MIRPIEFFRRRRRLPYYARKLLELHGKSAGHPENFAVQFYNTRDASDELLHIEIMRILRHERSPRVRVWRWVKRRVRGWTAA